MKPVFNKVSIIGVGLIGASLARGIKKNKISRQIAGFFKRKEALKKAVRGKIVDKGYLDIASAVKEAELVIFAVPVYEIIKVAEAIKDLIPSGALVTDIGSTKSQIVKKLSGIYPHYVGAHPLAGSEKKGAEFSSPDLFEGKITVLTPTKITNVKAANTMKKFWKALGAKVLIMPPATHDKMVSRISHLPHLLMYSLMEMVSEDDLKYASSGFKDSTRIAASDHHIWTEIFLSNKKYLLKDIDLFIKHLEKYRKFLSSSRRRKLSSVIENASEKRKRLK